MSDIGVQYNKKQSRSTALYQISKQFTASLQKSDDWRSVCASAHTCIMMACQTTKSAKCDDSKLTRTTTDTLRLPTGCTHRKADEHAGQVVASTAKMSRLDDVGVGGLPGEVTKVCWVAFFCLPSKRGGVSRLRRGKHRDCEGTHGPSNLDSQE